MLPIMANFSLNAIQFIHRNKKKKLNLAFLCRFLFFIFLPQKHSSNIRKKGYEAALNTKFDN